MRLHRFYVADLVLKQDFWLQDERLLHQWRKVLRFQPGQEVVLFDGVGHDRLYRLIELTDRDAHLELVTQLEPKLPAKDICLFWSLLKKDKNDWVLQKATELGVSHFVPLLADRSEKTGFNAERAEKIVIEAAEQCGRSDIPTIREPVTVATALKEFKNKISLYICEQNSSDAGSSAQKELGILIGPEGGWSEAEKELFKEQSINHLNLHDFTLRAETAAVTAIAKLLQ
jgi:16S rRNA (uracil1498-N3)-methyltransferase